MSKIDDSLTTWRQDLVASGWVRNRFQFDSPLKQETKSSKTIKYNCWARLDPASTPLLPNSWIEKRFSTSFQLSTMNGHLLMRRKVAHCWSGVTRVKFDRSNMGPGLNLTGAFTRQGIFYVVFIFKLPITWLLIFIYTSFI